MCLYNLCNYLELKINNMKKCIVFNFTILLLYVNSFGQNLIPNGSFIGLKSSFVNDKFGNWNLKDGCFIDEYSNLNSYDFIKFNGLDLDNFIVCNFCENKKLSGEHQIIRNYFNTTLIQPVLIKGKYKLTFDIAFVKNQTNVLFKDFDILLYNEKHNNADTLRLKMNINKANYTMWTNVSLEFTSNSNYSNIAFGFIPSFEKSKQYNFDDGLKLVGFLKEHYLEYFSTRYLIDNIVLINFD